MAQAIQSDSHRSDARRRPCEYKCHSVPIQLSLFFIIKKERKQIRGGQWLAGGYLRPSVLGLISVFPMDTAQIKKPVLFLSSSRFPFVQYLRRHQDAGYSGTTKHERLGSGEILTPPTLGRGFECKSSNYEAGKASR